MFMHLSEDILRNNDKGFIVIRIRKVTTWTFTRLSEDIVKIMIRGPL